VPQKGRPAKKVYRITERGQQELQGWLRQPPAADQIRREFLLKLYLAKGLANQDLLLLLANRRGETEAVFKALSKEKESTREPQQVWVVDYALSLCKAEIDWIRQLEAQFSVAQASG
jgi:hypothetical protein